MAIRDLTEMETELLCLLAIRGGVTWLRGDDAAVALGMADTPCIALGPTEAEGVVSAMLTDQGSAALSAPSDTKESAGVAGEASHG